MEETPEEKRVTEIVREAEEKIKDLNDPNRQRNKGPQPAPSGPVKFMGSSHYQKVDREAEKAYQEKAIRQEALNKAAEAIKNAPINVQVKAFKIADNFAYPQTAEKKDPSRQPEKQKDIDQAQRSAMRQMGKDEPPEKEPLKSIDEAQRSALVQMGHTPMKERGNAEKDLSESQDYAMRKLGDEKEKTRSGQPAKEEPAAKEAEGPKGFTESFSGAKYYQQLKEVTYTYHTPTPTPTSKKDRGPDLDR